MEEHSIGNVSIGYITSVESSEQSDREELSLVDRDSSVVFKKARSFDTLDIEFVLIPGDEKTIDERRLEVMELVKNPVENNDFEYLDWDGHLSIESVDISQSGSAQGVREGSISALFIPRIDKQVVDN